MVLTAKVEFDEGCTIPSCEGADAFKSVLHRFLPALAEIVFSAVP